MTERSNQAQDLRFLGEDCAYRQADCTQLSGEAGRDRMLDLYQLMQRGLVYPSPHSRFATLWVRPGESITRTFVRDAIVDIRERIHADFGSANTSAVMGVSFETFRQWCDADEIPYPAGMDFALPARISQADGTERSTSTVFARSAGSFVDSGADLWVHIKSDRPEHLAGVFDLILDRPSIRSTASTRWVFDPDTAVTSLPELVNCLICDWGHKMVEPVVSSLIGPVRVEGMAERWKRLREIALSYPRYGRAEETVDTDGRRVISDASREINALGDRIVRRIAELTVKVFREPVAATADKMLDYARKYGTPEHPFGFQIQPGAGTFENFVAFGGGNGASADGRRLAQPIASDLSPTPSPADRPANPRRAPFSSALAAYSGFDGGPAFSGAAGIWDGAPTDFNIDEDFPFEDLVRVLNQFADGHGSNILTITAADPAVLAEAPRRPEKYDLLRVRMGGWSEFFTSMFPDSQRQHQRRPLSDPD